MQIIKSKFIYFILIFSTLLMVVTPCFANTTSYVWSELSSPIVETVSSLNQDKRKFFKPHMW